MNLINLQLQGKGFY